MEIKSIEPKEIMNQEIERTKTEIFNMIMEDITPDRTLSEKLVDDVAYKCNELEGYLKCCADFGYFESRDKVGEFMSHFIDEIMQFVTINATNVVIIKH